MRRYKSVNAESFKKAIFRKSNEPIPVIRNLSFKDQAGIGSVATTEAGVANYITAVGDGVSMAITTNGFIHRYIVPPLSTKGKIKEVEKIVTEYVDRPVEVIKEVEPSWLTATVAFIRKVLHIQ